MPILNLDFLNKNQFRCYPFKATASRKAEDGRIIGNNLVSACNITTTPSRTDIHINQIFVQENFVSLTVACLEDGKFKSLGRFHGSPTENFSTLAFSQFERFVGGQLIIGSIEEIRHMSGGYFFEKSALPLEESAVFYYTPPGVTSINYEEASLRGRVRFGKLFNLTKTVNKADKKISLAVQDNSGIASLADHTSEFNNCRTPLIHYVNGSKPFYNSNNPTHQGNLYLVGVKPIVFYGDMGEGSLEIQTKLLDGQPLDLAGLCTARNKVLPPVNPVYLVDRTSEIPEFEGKANFYGKSFDPPETIFSNSDPEFLSWPQFFKNFFKSYTVGTIGQAVEIKQINQEKGKIYQAIVANTGTAPARVSLLKNSIALPEVENLIIPPNSKTIKKITSPIQLEEGLNFSFMGNVVEGVETSVQIMLFYR